MNSPRSCTVEPATGHELFHPSFCLPWIKVSPWKNHGNHQPTKKVKQKTGFWMDFVFCPWFCFFFFSGMPIAVWVVCNTPSIDFFRSVGVRSASCKNKSQIWPIGSYVLWSKVEDLARSCHHSWHSTFRAKVEDLPPVDIYNFRIGDLKKNIFVCHLFFEEKNIPRYYVFQIFFFESQDSRFCQQKFQECRTTAMKAMEDGPRPPFPGIASLLSFTGWEFRKGSVVSPFFLKENTAIICRGASFVFFIVSVLDARNVFIW